MESTKNQELFSIPAQDVVNLLPENDKKIFQ